MSELTKQHFEDIVRVIKNSIDDIERETQQYTAVTKEGINKVLCKNFADYLSTTNPRFDRGRFIDKCMIKK